MNRWHPTLAIAAGALVLLTAAGGGFSPGASQAPARPQAPQVPPAFRLSTTMVEVDATVVDGSGKFVDSLGIDDFEILDEGAPRPVQVLYLVDGPVVKALAKPGGPTPAPPPEGAIPQPQATPLPDQVRLAMSQAPQRVLILFFDQDHLDQSSFNRVRQASERFLTTRFQDGDLGGVLMGTTMVGNRLTKDRQELLSAVQSAKLNPGQSLIRNELRDYPRMTQIEAVRIALSNDSRVLDQVTDRAAREGGGAGGRGGPDLRPLVMEKARNVVVQLQQSTVSTLKAMQGLLNGLARVPGRKSVLFITEGFLFEQSWADLRVLVGQAARANVRIYTIDALGLRRGERETDLSMMTPVETGSQVPLEAYNTVEEGPNTLAVDTGGYVIRKTND
ncbi:MAG: VWFA-related Acidobacterial domain protein, partial [Acidobacteria bacterium]|nr:VWFA-related Acidobacterial domain protein [Acidobacteriota bacterium]